MNLHDLARRLHRKTPSKIVLAVADGLGGLPMNADGQTELEAARTPNPDALAREGTTGFLATELMPLAIAHAGKFDKFGA